MRDNLAAYHNTLETDESIWNGLKSSAIWLKIKQFLYKALHGMQKIGKYWTNIDGHKERQCCPTCETAENMEHILTQCSMLPINTIWSLTQQLWPHPPHLWPTPSLDIILGCGAIHLPSLEQPPGTHCPPVPPHLATTKAQTNYYKY
jgi:hypothetical protein